MILLLSGGVDSAALCWQLRPNLGLFIDYGQLAAEAEREAASNIAESCGVDFYAVAVSFGGIGSGEMHAKGSRSKHAPVPEWWPFRNQLLVTLAAAKAVELNCKRVVIGSVSTDRCMSDGTPEFVSQLSDLLKMQEGGIEVIAPAIEMTSSQLVTISELPRKILALTFSCHRGTTPCGLCRGCTKRIELFEAVGVLGDAAQNGT